jgi:hypothetical protein
MIVGQRPKEARDAEIIAVLRTVFCILRWLFRLRGSQPGYPARFEYFVDRFLNTFSRLRGISAAVCEQIEAHSAAQQRVISSRAALH